MQLDLQPMPEIEGWWLIDGMPYKKFKNRDALLEVINDMLVQGWNPIVIQRQVVDVFAPLTEETQIAPAPPQQPIG